MAPTRKSRSVNKQFSSLNEVSPEKDGVNSNKTKQRKRKLSDKLGSQWSKSELQRFYEAYRKYGRDWKKVAIIVRNRSVEMVEALYNMNRAYLSLPEGTASVVGLIAMMTDHYNVLEGSDSERESSDALGSRKTLKRKRGKVHPSAFKDSIQAQSIASNDGCLSLLKKRRFDGTQPRAVGKRTPRVPVYREDYVSPKKRSLKSAVDADDDEVARVAALALTEAAQRGGSPQVSHTQYTKAELTFSPVQRWERMYQMSGTARAMFFDSSKDERSVEGSIDSREAENGEYDRETSSLMDMKDTETVELPQKVGKVYRKKEMVENVRNHQLDNGEEACGGTEEGLSFSPLKEKADIEVNAKPEQSSPKCQRKRNKKLISGGELPALDALETLADLSLMMPASTTESGSSVQLKKERLIVEKDDNPTLPESTSTSHNGDKFKLPGLTQKVGCVVPGAEDSPSRKSKIGKESTNDTDSLSDSKEQLPSADKTWKRKRKTVVSKAADEEKKPVIKGQHTDQVCTLLKQLKSVKSSESSLCSGKKFLTVTTSEVPHVSEASLPTKRRSRRKMILQRTFMPKEKSFENILKSQPNKYSPPLQDSASYLKNQLSSCLSSYMVRRWFTFEWFYSTIDYPWFAKKEFMEYLNHVGLGNIPRLSRVEWGVIKSSLGKPRRFSEHFLCEERHKLEQYRASVRKHYSELRTGIRDGLPTDLARPLYVGQRVIAIHPKTREIHDGSVLTVDHDKCRVQFDCPDLGVEFVMDIDCMPFNPLDNMPESLRRQIDAGKFSYMRKEPQMNGNSRFGGCMTRASSGSIEKGDANHTIAQTKDAGIENLSAQQAVCAQPCPVTHHQAKEADVHALSELTRSLDKKETLLTELRNANNDIMENQHDQDCLKNSEAFKKQYSMVLVQLKEASEQVSNALLRLRQHNTYTASSLPSWMMPHGSCNVRSGLPSLLDSSLAQELGSTVIEIIKGSRLRAYAMVDTAFQALSSTKEGEDAFKKIGKALDSIDYQQLASNSRLPMIRSQEQVNGSFNYYDRSISCTSGPSLNDASGPKLHIDSDKVGTQIPSELITSCVATLIMIQTCTKRQYPPADVAQVLDSAVTSLQPCCPRNLPIYREIQMCMGRIKTQILALIPT